MRRSKSGQAIMENRRYLSGREYLWPVGLLLVVFLFLLPIILGWHGIFIDDVAIHCYQNQLFQAKCLQQGIVPLWDPHTHAGGHPFYLRQEDYAFYPVQWFFGLLGDITPSTRSFRDLIIIPIVVHFLWGSLGMYVLGRWGLGFSRPGSTMMALIFAFSTSMLGGIVGPDEAISMSWHPWLVAAVLLYARKRRTGWIIFGAVVLALGAPAWTANTIHGLILAAYFGLILLGWRWKEEGGVVALKLAGGLFGMVLIGILLSAPFWLAAIESWRYLEATYKVDYNLLTAGPRSLPWRWLATIFVPELFGSTNFDHFWGAARDYQMYWSEARLTRGMLIWFPAFLALWTALASLIRRLKSPVRAAGRSDPREGNGYSFRVGGPVKERAPYLLWTWAAAGLLVLSIFLMAGRFSPVFGWLYRLGPLFRIPYATRWHTFYTMGLSILTGVGVSQLFRRGGGRVVATRMRVISYLYLATLVPLAAVILPIGYWDKLADYRWFIKFPGLYWLIGVVLLLVIVVWKRPRWTGPAVVALSLAGLLRSAYWDAYRPMGYIWTTDQVECSGPEESELFRFMALASQSDPGPLFRTGYSRVFADTSGLIYGSYSLLGSGIKPMVPRAYHTLKEICKDMPYETALRDPTLPFVRNMSVGFWWYDHPLPPSSEWEYVAEAPGYGQYLFRIPGALPRIYFQDRLSPGSEQESRQALLYGDLREAAVVDRDDQEIKKYLQPEPGKENGGSPESHFAALQEENRVLRVDFAHPQAVEIEVKVSIPALLVMTDAWHPGWRAVDNGRPITIHRVNCYQRGIWLEKGRHLVRMEFLPSCVRVGRWISLAGVILCGVLLWMGRKKKFQHG